MPTLSNNELTITIKGVDDASPALKSVKNSVDGVSDSSERNTGVIAKLKANWAPIAAVTAAASVAFSGTVQTMESTITAANNLQGALTGLNSVARAFGVDQNAANQAARSLAKDGLMTVTEAATGLKNLLASHFNLDQAITLMDRFKDSAAFNRQASLGFGEAVATATEGIKNGNSILVDNAGVTKNLSIILQEAGYSQQDVGRASTDAGVRMALYNGILKETNPQVGDAARLADQFAGKQAKASAATLTLQQNIGTAIQSALLPFLQAITPILTGIATWVQQHQKLTAVIVIAVTVFLALAAAVGAVAGIIALVGASAVGIFAAVVGAVAAAAAAIIVYWQPIVNLFTGLWNGIVAIVTTAINGIVAAALYLRDNWATVIGEIIGFFATLPIRLPALVIQAIVSIISFLATVNWGAVFGAIGNAFVTIWDNVRSATVNAFNFIRSINWGDVLVSIGRGIGNAIIDLINAAIKGAFSGIPVLKDHVPQIPHFAAGTNFAPGGMALVGENGPELVNLPRGSQVKTTAQTQQALSQRRSGVNMTNYFNVTNQVDLDKAVAVIGFRLAVKG